MMEDFSNGTRTSPYSEHEILNVLHGTPWQGISYLGSANSNPLYQPLPQQPSSTRTAPACARLHGLGNSQQIAESQQQFSAWVNQEIGGPTENEGQEAELATENQDAHRSPKRHKSRALVPMDLNKQIESDTAEIDKSPATKPWFGKVIGLGGSSNGKKPPATVWVWFHSNDGFSDFENTLVSVKKLGEELLPELVPSFLQDHKAWSNPSEDTVKAARSYFELAPGRRIGVQFGGNVDNATVEKATETTVTVKYDDHTTSHVKWDPIFSKKPWRFLHERLDSTKDMNPPSDSDGSDSDLDALDSDDE